MHNKIYPSDGWLAGAAELRERHGREAGSPPKHGISQTRKFVRRRSEARSIVSVVIANISISISVISVSYDIIGRMRR